VSARRVAEQLYHTLLQEEIRLNTTAEQKRKGWEMAVRIEKILCTVLHETYQRQVEETMETLSEGPEEFLQKSPGLRAGVLSWGSGPSS
jgi:hypothetical protein